MLLIASAAFCWGSAATLGKLVFNGYFTRHGSAAEISPVILAQTRTTLSFLMLAPLLALFGGRKHFSAPRKSILFALIVGAVGLAGSNFFYYYAIEKTSVSIAIVLQYFAPVWVLLYMLMRKRQRATLPRILGVSIAVAGSALAVGIASSGFHVHVLGFAAAEAAGICFAFYNVAGGYLVERQSPITVMIYAVLGAAILWACVNPPWVLVRMPFSAQQWWFLFGFAALSMMVPFLLYLTGLQFLDPTSAIVTSCLEPVFAISLAALFAGETVHPLQAFGIALVLGATVLIQKPERTAATATA